MLSANGKTLWSDALSDTSNVRALAHINRRYGSGGKGGGAGIEAAAGGWR